MMSSVIEMKGIRKTYNIGEVAVDALRGIDLRMDEMEFLAVMGSSGSGKSTLMNIIGCLDQPTSGSYLLDGMNVEALKGNEYSDIRNQKIGFVFQAFNLLPRTTALDNVELPLLYDRTGRIKNPRKAARDALERVGLADRLSHKTNQLSGGQQQRVALARALVNQPAIILADEPTGNLDSRTSVEVLSVFQELNDQGITIIIVTHEPELAVYAKRIVRLRDGLIVSDTPVQERRRAAEDLVHMQEVDIEAA